MRRSFVHPSIPARRGVLVALLALAAAGLTACSDAPPPTASSPVEEAIRPGAVTRDGSIRRDDSHFTARLRVSRSVSGASLREGVAFADAQLNAQLNAPSEETLYIEGGYGAAGELRFGVYWDAQPATSPYSGIRTVGDRLEMLNAQGQVVSSKLFDTHMAEAGLPGGTLIGAYFPSGEPGLITCRPGDPGCGPGAGLRDGADLNAAVSDQTPIGGTKELRRTLRAAAGGAARGGADDRSETVRLYRRISKDAWRLEEVRQTDHTTTARGPRVSEQVTRITYGAWNRDLLKDSARTIAPRSRAPLTAAAPMPAPSSLRMDTPQGVPPTQNDVLFGICDRGGAETNIVRSKSTRGLSVVFQHGFCADAAVWDGMRPRVASAFNVVRERAFSLETTVRAEAQVTELKGRLLEMDSRPSVMIGHSLGGLLARRLGQRDPGLVSGVITIGSPNGGARIADLGPDAAAELIESATGRICVGAWLCQALAALLIDEYAGQLLFGAPGLVPPVLQDLRTGSPFLQTLNSTPESFPRAGIEVDAGNRWAVFRMLGDARSPRTRVISGVRPYGHDWVATAEGVYRSARLLQILSLFAYWDISTTGGGVDCRQSGYAAYWTPCVDYDWRGNWGAPGMSDALAYLVYQLASFVIGTMNTVDQTWDWITTGGLDRTDGLVALTAQRYPNAPGAHPPVRVLITPPDADSHAGETASPRVVERTIDLIRTLGLAGM